MSWKTEVLSNAVDFIDGDRGINYPTKNELMDFGDCLFLDTGNVQKNGFDFSSTTFITREKDQLLNKGKLDREDIVLTTRGTLGNVGYYSSTVPYEHIRINSGMLILRAKDHLAPKFLFYWLQSPQGKGQITSSKSGSAQPQLPVKTLSRFSISYPDRATQERIADFLSVYDLLIENNRKQIKLLEEAAQRLYKEWFVDMRFPGHESTPINPTTNLPEGWHIGDLEEIIKLQSGYAFKSSSFDENGNYRIATIKNVQDGIFSSVKMDAIAEIPTAMPLHCKLALGDILLSLTGNVGRVCHVDEDNILLNQRVARIQTAFPGFAYLLFCANDFRTKLEALSTGTAQKNLSPIKTMALKINIPGENVMNRFESLLKPIYIRKMKLLKMIKAATEARNRLLPKLMSGEIEV